MKITTLIPAFKPKYLGPLLRGLGSQSVKPDRIILSDDSPDRAFRDALQSKRYRRLVDGVDIEVIDGPRAGPHPNIRHLLRKWNAATEFLHIMLDDDVVYPEFYKRHLAAHAGGAFSCTVSRRWTALESGQPVEGLRAPKEVSNNPLREVPVNAGLAFASTLPYCVNWFGETSNVVFRKEVAGMIDATTLAGIPFSGLTDLGSVLCASLQKPVCFLNEYLGAFRKNPGQMTAQTFSRTIKQGHLAWIALALAGQRIGKLNPAQLAACCNAVGPLILQRYAQEADMAPFRDLIRGLKAGQNGADERFLEAWNLFARYDG